MADGTQNVSITKANNESDNEDNERQIKESEEQNPTVSPSSDLEVDNNRRIKQPSDIFKEQSKSKFVPVSSTSTITIHQKGPDGDKDVNEKREHQGARPKERTDKTNLAKGFHINTNPNRVWPSPKKEESVDQYGERLSREYLGQAKNLQKELDDVLPNINKEITVHVMDKNNNEINNILVSVCACLNSKDNVTRTLLLKNIQHNKSVPKKFDIWYDRIEKKMKEYFSPNISDYVQFKGQCNFEELLLHVIPAKRVCTLNTYLYYPSVSGVAEVTYDKAIDIMLQQGPPTSLQLLSKDYNYDYNKTVENLQGENTDVQFKEIKGENIPNTLANMASEYVSAFSNYKGGCIYFGIDDANAKVVGVDTRCGTKAIESALERKVYSMIKGEEERLQRGLHWDVHFYEIKNLPDDMINNKIIVVSVSRTPGGVFTAVPRSYYADDHGNVKQYQFQEWRNKMISSYKGAPATKKDVGKLATKEDVGQLATKEDLGQLATREDMGQLATTVVEQLNNRLLSIQLAVGPNADSSQNVQVDRVVLGGVSVVEEADTMVLGGVSVVEDAPTNIDEWHFTRNPVKTRLTEEFQEVIQKNSCVILKGLIGTGKTDLALRYCYNIKQEHRASVVWKLTSSDKSLFERSMFELWHNLEPDYRSLPQTMNDDASDQLGKLILKKLQDRKHSVHVLILDDVKKDSQRFVNNFMKKMLTLGHLKIIVTTPLSFHYESEVKVIEVGGFLLNEAVVFLHEGRCTLEDKDYYEAIAKKLSCNPKGLSIIRSYMTHMQLTAKALLGQLSKPSELLALENSSIIKDLGHEKTLFTSLINVVRELHIQYRNDGKETVFEMMLLLQFLEVEKIPLILFANLKPTVTDLNVNEFCHGVVYRSFGICVGKHNGFYDERLLSTHEVAATTFQIYSEIFSSDIQPSDIVLRKSLLRSLHLLMDKDNGSQLDYLHHMLLLPHGRKVVNNINFQFKNSQTHAETVLFQDTELMLRLICMNDILGYQFSYSEMYRDAHYHFEIAKNILFKMLGLNGDYLDKNLKIYCKEDLDFAQLRRIAKENCMEIYRGIQIFLKEENNVSDLRKIFKDYAINKNRNLADVKVLRKLLDYRELEQKSKLSDNEYSELCKRGYAILDDDLADSCLCEVVLSTLHTYGRRLFYLQERENQETARFYCIYLYMAHELCLLLTINSSHLVAEVDTTRQIRLKYNTIYSLVIQRSVIQSTLQPRIRSGVNYSIILQENIKVCMQHLKDCEEDINYLEFGVLKVQTRTDDHNKALWLKQIVGCYKVLITKDQNRIAEGIKHGGELHTLIQDMKNKTGYPGLVCSLGELQFVCGNKEEAEKYFKEILPTLSVSNDQVSLSKHERKACIYTIRCRIDRNKDEIYNKETLQKIEAYKIGLRKNETQLQELKDLETIVKDKLGINSPSLI